MGGSQSLPRAGREHTLSRVWSRVTGRHSAGVFARGEQDAEQGEDTGTDSSDQAADAPAAPAAKKGLGMLGGGDLLIVALYVVWETINVLCIAWAKDPATKEAAYSAPTLVFAAESAKFAISAAELRRAGLGAADVDWVQNWKFAIPALLYSINNNLFVYILRIVPGSVFQMLSNLRSLYTGVLFYFLMDRRLSRQQWMALVLLVVGAGLCQYANTDDDSNLRVSQWGVFLSVVYGFISVGAGVWSELLLKKGTKGIHLDNSQLYAYGMFFNFVGVLVAARTGGGWHGGMRGWDVWSTWLICFNMAATGIVCSLVLKYYDNVIKIFAVTASNAVVYVFDIFIMQDQRFHPLFLLGMVVVAFAMVRYNRPTDLQQPERVLAVSLPTVVAQTGVGAPDGGDQAPLLDDLPDGGDQAPLLDDLPGLRFKTPGRGHR